MSNDLHDLLGECVDQIVEHVEEGLRLPQHPHYEALGPVRVKKRVKALVDAFIASLQGHSDSFVRHVERVAEERAQEGFLLHEIQDTLTGLEGCAWDLVVKKVPAEEQVSTLGRITTTVGRAKDALARVYLAQRRHAESEIARLQDRLHALLSGTISSELREDD